MKANRIIVSALDYGTTIISNVRMKTLLLYVLLFRLSVVVLACIIYIYIYIYHRGTDGKDKNTFYRTKIQTFSEF